ncbi:MAG: hypothetical protein JJU11_02995 [Candidatus Sumerlaeia bacterium]|nr:hypothetical protein [Candidatus Sumerlaeia bacterium]
MFKTFLHVPLLGAFLMSAGYTLPANNDLSKVRKDHGITLFYTADTPVEDLTGLKFPEVYGGELIIFWHEFEPEDGVFDWSRMDRDFEAWHTAGKKLDIRLATAHVSPIHTPQWVFTDYHVRRIGRGIFENFEDDNRRYDLGEISSLTSVGEHVFTGTTALHVSNTGDAQAPFMVQGGPPLDQSTMYSIQWDYLPIAAAEMAVEVVGEDGEIRQHHRVSPTREGWNVGTVELELDGETGQRIQLSAMAGTEFSVDNVNIIRTTPTAEYRSTDLMSDVPKDWIPAGNGESYSEEEFRLILSNSPNHFPLRRGDGLQIRFELMADSPGGEFRAVLRSRTNHTRVHFDSIVEVPVGLTTGVHFHVPSILPDDDQELLVLYKGPPGFQIRKADWRRWTDQVTVFPDYFSEDFNTLWRRAVVAFADRYRNHPALGIVSVGGFGRWEEVMLDEDVYGALDDQWLSRGFTQEKYMDQVIDSMDLYRGFLPDAALRICLAYGLKMVNDVDWIYRRSAQAAVERGIGLKQNGLSERYDTWDANTNTSYLYHYYRHHEGITLTHETGGQIFRNLANAHGYAASLLNRSAANYTDYLFLYFNDIHGRHIRKYFHTFLEHSGKTAPTTFHAWLGDMSQVHEHRTTPVATQNIWFGLRQFDGPGQTPLKARVNGEKVLQTNATNHRIVFDVDDRFQYSGMYGTELSIDYLDYPAGPFHVQVLDQSTRRWRSLGTIQRNGTNEFRRAFFYDSTWNNSPRHSGEDDHADLIIKEPTGQAPLSLRNVELQFVAPGDWAMDDHDPKGTPSHGVLANPSLSHIMEIPDDHPRPHVVSILLHAPDRKRATVVGRVYKVESNPGREILLSEKEFHIPADKDTLQLPFVPTADLSSLKIELSALEGNVGWYLDEGGDPCITLSPFSMKRKELTADSHVPLHAGGNMTGFLTTIAPLQAIELEVANSSQDFQVNVLVQREVPGNGWSAPILKLERFLIPHSGTVRLPIVPQPAGRFRIILDGHWGTGEVAVTSNGDMAINPIGLVRRYSPREPRYNPIENAIKTLPFPGDWKILSGLVSSDNPTDQIFNIVDFDPALEVDTSLITSKRHHLHLFMKNRSGANMARVYWGTADDEYNAGRSILLPIVPNDEYVRQYSFPIGLEDTWQGSIDRIKVHPVVGSTRHGQVMVEALVIEENNIHTDLDFSRPLDYLAPERDIHSIERLDEGLLVTIAGSSPVLRIPLQDFNVESCLECGGEILVLRMKNKTRSNEMRLLWHVPDERFMNPRRAFEEEIGRYTSASIPISSNDSTVQEYRIPLSDLPGWESHIVTMALIPAFEAEVGGEVLIESLRIFDGDGKTERKTGYEPGR